MKCSKCNHDIDVLSSTTPGSGYIICPECFKVVRFKFSYFKNPISRFSVYTVVVVLAGRNLITYLKEIIGFYSFLIYPFLIFLLYWGIAKILTKETSYEVENVESIEQFYSFKDFLKTIYGLTIPLITIALMIALYDKLISLKESFEIIGGGVLGGLFLGSITIPAYFQERKKIATALSQSRESNK